MKRFLSVADLRRRGRVHLLPPPRPEPVPEVVELAEQLGRWAAEGDVVAVGFVVVHADGAVGTAFYHGRRWAELLAGASCLRRRLEDVS